MMGRLDRGASLLDGRLVERRRNGSFYAVTGAVLGPVVFCGWWQARRGATYRDVGPGCAKFLSAAGVAFVGFGKDVYEPKDG
jgi:hypothetical protein